MPLIGVRPLIGVLAAFAAASAAAEAQTPKPTAGNPLDYRDYLRDKAAAEPTVTAPPDAAAVGSLRQAVVTIDGRPYYKFAAGDKGAVLVPKLTHLTKSELERAVCSEDLKAVCDQNKVSEDPKVADLCKTQGLTEAIVAQATYKLADDVALYAGAIINTIQTSCGGSGVTPNATRLYALLFEVGIEAKNKDPRHPGSKKIFIRPLPLKPEVGVGTSF